MKVLKILLLAVLAVTFASCVTKTEEPEIVYSLGDIGPGGGVVFYDAGNYNNNWRYLEAELDAYNEWLWGSDKALIKSDKKQIGTGMANSKKIAGKTKGNYRAADVCYSKKYGNGLTKGWFLPSVDELNELYAYLLTTDYEPKYTSYWTSTEVSVSEAYYMTIEGDIRVGGKSTIHGIFLVRAL